MAVTIKELELFYKDKHECKCKLTEKLIQAGYQQTKGGYITYAQKVGEPISYKDAQPSQWWHLICSYCGRANKNRKFSKQIQCGELLFWMAEVGKCVELDELENLLKRILESGIPVKRRNMSKPPVRYDRRKWNKEISDLCFEKIVYKVENYFKSGL